MSIPMDVDSDIRGKTFTVTAPAGFMVEEHSYYRQAVDELGYTIKPYQYELELELHEEDLVSLKEYLSQNFQSGENVELWSIWVGIDQSGRVSHYSGCLKDFDMETMEQFLKPGLENNAPGQHRFTITI